jgi:hypothetical protein
VEERKEGERVEKINHLVEEEQIAEKQILCNYFINEIYLPCSYIFYTSSKKKQKRMYMNISHTFDIESIIPFIIPFKNKVLNEKLVKDKVIVFDRII